MAAAKALAPGTATARGFATAEGSLRTHEGLSDLTKLMVSIAEECGDDEAAARRMLLARLRSRDVNQSGGAAGARRGADAGRSPQAAAPGNKRSAQGDASAGDAVGAPATTAKKAKPAARPVTPDAGLAAVAGPGAPAEASVSVVSPEVSSGSQASYPDDTARAQPPAASLLAKRRAAQRAALPAAKKPKPESSA